MDDTNDNYQNLTDPESEALKKKLKGRQQQQTAEEMKKDGNIGNVLGGKVEEIKGILNERSADADLKKISEDKLAASQKPIVVS